MKPDRNPATPDVMALLCLISGAVAAAGESNLLMQLLLIGTYCRPVGHALNVWIETEERFAYLEFEESAIDVEDGWDGEDDTRPGRMTKLGRVEIWRHVTRFGLALLIPIQWGGMILAAVRPYACRVWCPACELSTLSFSANFCRGCAAPSNHALFVTISK